MPPPPAPAPSPSASGGVQDLQDLSLAVVAEKTGYPVETLGTHMLLEADLGIDSIKRVEILSAVRQRVSELANVDVSDLAKAHSVGEVLDRLRAVMAPRIVRSLEAQPGAGAVRLSTESIRAGPAGLATPGLASGRIVVAGGASIIATQVVAHLTQAGLGRSHRRSHWRRLWRDLPGRARGAGATTCRRRTRQNA